MSMPASVFCVLVIQALVLTNNAVSVSGCAYGWEGFNGACYGYSEAKVSFGDAVAICYAKKAKLVEIDSYQESTFVIELANKNKAEYVWIGGSDMFREGTWEWIDSGYLISAFKHWGAGEPNDAGSQEECVLLRRSDSYRWNDVSCGEKVNFICEKAG